ncbi:MAG: TIGR04255 family protein [Phycisphaerae bacterium]|nr:TIGR04255 family protein [Phycisphaerae bacterium]
MHLQLPSYRRPPVVETVLSLQFKPIPGFTNAHLGIFWQSVRNEFPKATDADPIASQRELFGDRLPRRPRLPAFRIFPAEAASRLQMSSEDGERVVQLQNGRLISNWRRMTGAEYPRWRKVAQAFEQRTHDLRTMLSAEGLADVEANQWEVTYVNYLVKGREWTEPSDWPKIIPGLLGRAELAKGGSLEGVESSTHFVLPNKTGRLHIDLHRGFTTGDPDADEVLVLQLTARGAIAQSELNTIAQFLDIGHVAIVQAFTDLTGQEAHALWEREE